MVMGAEGGALGGTLVRGALWGLWWQVRVWIAALVEASAVVVWGDTSASDQRLGLMTGWSLFWGVLIGVVEMWGAQLDGAGWAYGIEGGVGFLIGITQGV